MSLVGLALLIWLGAWWVNTRLAASGWGGARLVAPVIFGLTVLAVWELVVRGLGVSAVILPPPSAIGAKFVNETGTLWVDFQQTALKGAASGYIIGCIAAFGAALAIDRSPFLQRGLLPIGNFVAALPIVGTAPILVGWLRR